MEIWGQVVGAVGGIAAAIIAGVMARRESAMVKALSAAAGSNARLSRSIDTLCQKLAIKEVESDAVTRDMAEKLSEIHASVRDGKAECRVCEATVDKIDRAAERILEGRAAG